MEGRGAVGVDEAEESTEVIEAPVEEEVTEEATEEAPEEEAAEVEEEASKPAPVAKVRRDPTEGMTVEQKLEYYQKRSGHFEKEYTRERTKRQGLQKGGAGTGFGASTLSNMEQRDEGKKVDPRALDDLTPTEFAERIREELRGDMKREMSEGQIVSRIRASEAWAKEQFDGSDGAPTYEAMLDDHVAPFLRENPDVVKILRKMPNPALATYKLGEMLMGDEHKTERVKQSARKDLVEKINDAAKAGRKPTTQARLPSTQKKKIDDMSADEFEAEIARVKDQ